MRIISVFNFITLNGFYKGLKEDISWHSHGKEEGEFSEKGAQSDNILLFGSRTYKMMAGFWPTQQAAQMFPKVADGMNKSEKIVFSKKMKKAGWNNTTIISGDIISKIKKLRKTAGPDMTILGSGSIVTQFANAGLIDTYQVMIDPVALGAGTPMFKGLKKKLDLNLADSKVFKSGVVLLTYKPIK